VHNARVMKGQMVESEPKPERQENKISQHQQSQCKMTRQFSLDCVLSTLSSIIIEHFQEQITRKYITIDVLVQNYIR